MLKSKMGVPIALLGAATFFLGALSLTPTVLLIGYILIREENEWLRNVAIKASGVIIFFGLISVGFNCINEILQVLNVIVQRIDSSATTIAIPFDINSLLKNLLAFIENIVFVVIGFKALSMKTVKFGPIEKILNKYIS